MALRGSRWLLRELDPASAAPQTPAPVEVPRTSRALALPDGLDEPTLRRIYSTWSVDGEPAGHLDPYVGDSFERFVHTYELAAATSGRCLELGANPYFTTYLLDDHTDLDLTLANFFGQDGGTLTQVLAFEDAEGKPVERSYECDLFNIEDRRFPYDDGSFEVVLFCEILEHLLMDPVGVLTEIRRVLVDDGCLVLTTPNVARFDNACRLVTGENIYDPYSGFGPYGRHNREYTMRELRALLAFVGFEVEEAFSGDGHPTDHRGLAHAADIAPLVTDRPDLLGGYLYVRAVKSGEVSAGLPDFLYRSWPADRLVSAPL